MMRRASFCVGRSTRWLAYTPDAANDNPNPGLSITPNPPVGRHPEAPAGDLAGASFVGGDDPADCLSSLRHG
jgi:hypothetical protein